MSSAEDVAARSVAETYYDSTDADRFYFTIWGGEDIHIGLYDETDDIAEASRLTVEKMAGMIDITGGKPQVLDIGAGYGGAARYLAASYGWSVRCLNISQTQNETNRRHNREQRLDRLVSVVHGSFEAIPEPDASFDAVWSQDAILHSGNRPLVFDEVVRVLRPGGDFVLTDPMQADDCPDGVLQPVYDRLQLTSLGSFSSYRRMAEERGMQLVEQADLTPNLRTHYSRVAEELRGRRNELSGQVADAYIERMLTGLDNWVKAADSGYLAWGIQHFRRGA
jgi:sarcosine/dimethylglycine N-methyltransferase